MQLGWRSAQLGEHLDYMGQDLGSCGQIGRNCGRPSLGALRPCYSTGYAVGFGHADPNIAAVDRPDVGEAGAVVPEVESWQEGAGYLFVQEDRTGPRRGSVPILGGIHTQDECECHICDTNTHYANGS
mmetsp:Transcript_19762/g.39373  ORF Transcript_19762/g.39373 Transcript_19762/m.39373 type:complete len:128 (+) Transcript_19762:119-502(+)